MNLPRTLNYFLFVAVCCPLLAGDESASSNFPINRETTYVTGPVNKNGSIDYLTAINEALRGKITPEQNANVLIVQALGPHLQSEPPLTPDYFQWLGIAAPPRTGTYLVSLVRYLERNPFRPGDDIGILYEKTEAAIQVPWKAADLPHVAAWLDSNRIPLELAVAASRRHAYFNPLVGPDPKNRTGGVIAVTCPTAHAVREICRALQARAMLRASEGKLDDSWNDLQAIHRLARLVGRGGSLVELLCGYTDENYALRGELAYLAMANLNAEQIQRRRAELQKFAPLPTVAEKADFFERLLWLDTLQHARFGNWEPLQSTSYDPKRPVDLLRQATLSNSDWSSAYRLANRWHDRVVQILHIPDRELRRKEYRSLAQEFDLRNKVAVRVPAETLGDLVMSSHIPSIHSIQRFHDQVIQFTRNVDVAYAAAAYRRETGRSPGQWDDLIPRYLPQVPVDLFTGKPMGYRATPDGFQFYSIGMNEKDEGGRGRLDRPSGDDLSVQLSFPKLIPK